MKTMEDEKEKKARKKVPANWNAFVDRHLARSEAELADIIHDDVREILALVTLIVSRQTDEKPNVSVASVMAAESMMVMKICTAIMDSFIDSSEHAIRAMYTHRVRHAAIDNAISEHDHEMEMEEEEEDDEGEMDEEEEDDEGALTTGCSARNRWMRKMKRSGRPVGCNDRVQDEDG